jgi:hypothetical protein
MKLILVIAASLLLCIDAQAQLRKCTGPDGKVTYSDVLCNSSSSTGSIKNADGNSLDTSGFRREAQGLRAREERAQAEDEMSDAMRNKPGACKFSYHSVGDERGKALATNAKRECIENILAAKQGQPKSMEHYSLWKDHYDQTSSRRQAALTGANADANARATQQATQQAIESASRKAENKRFTCTPNGLGKSMDCR